MTWIWTGGERNPANHFTWFRRVVDLADAPEVAELRFAADSTAQLWVNGAIVRRKVTRFHEPAVRAEVVPIARQLRPGRNVVVVLHHSWGDIVTFQRTGGSHAGLYLQSSWVETDEEWRWLHAAEFEAHTDQFRGLAGGAPRIRYPVRWNAAFGEDPARFHDPDYDDAQWGAVVPVNDGPWPDHPLDVETPGQRESRQVALSVLAAGQIGAGAGVVPDPIATDAAADLIRRKPSTITGLGGETHYVTVDLQRPVHGYPFIELELEQRGDALPTVFLGYGELAVSPYSGRDLVTTDGGIDVGGVVAECYGDTLWPARGRRCYEFPDERTARWLTVQVTFSTAGSITLHGLGIIKSQYPIEPRGTFQCGDERVDQIVKLAFIHAEITMSDAYVDTPGREDGQWIEDARPRAILASRWFGDLRLRRLMIRSLAEGQRADGNLHPFFPSNYPYGPSQWDWSLQWIGMIVDDYRWTGDTAFLSGHFPAIELMLTAVSRDVGADGVWRSAHVFGDIRNSAALGDGGSSGIVTPWLIDRLGDSAELARALGRNDLADAWSTLAGRVAAAFRVTHLTAKNRWGVPLVADSLDADGVASGFSQAGQIVPLYDGLLTRDEALAVIDTAFPAPDASPPPHLARWNNPTWSYRVLRGLSEHGFQERALAHLLERYGPSLPGHPDNPVGFALQGPYGGPLPEYWISRRDLGLAHGELNDRQPIDPTGSHGWGAMPLLWLHEYLLGVTILTPGGAELAVRPASAGLPYVVGTTITPFGPVFVQFEPSEPRLVVEIPAGAIARLTLPREFAGARVIADVDVSGSGEATLSKGRWEFTSRGPSW